MECSVALDYVCSWSRAYLSWVQQKPTQEHYQDVFELFAYASLRWFILFTPRVTLHTVNQQYIRKLFQILVIILDHLRGLQRKDRLSSALKTTRALTEQQEGVVSVFKNKFIQYLEQTQAPADEEASRIARDLGQRLLDDLQFRSASISCLLINKNGSQETGCVRNLTACLSEKEFLQPYLIESQITENIISANYTDSDMEEAVGWAVQQAFLDYDREKGTSHQIRNPSDYLVLWFLDSPRDSYEGGSIFAPAYAVVRTALEGRSISETFAATGAFKQGKLIRVNGIPVKVRTAVDSGKKNIILPVDNLDEAPEDLKEYLLPADTVSQIFWHISRVWLFSNYIRRLSERGFDHL
jgi:hypothetical protein